MNRLKMNTLIIATSLITLLCNTASAQLPLDFSKAWFSPVLVENKDPVCNSLLEGAKRDFFAIPNNQSEISIPNQINDDWILQTEPYETPLPIDSKKIFAKELSETGCGGACDSSFLAFSTSSFNETTLYIHQFPHEKQMTEAVAAYQSHLGIYLNKNGSYYAIAKNDLTNAYKIKSDATLDKVCVISSKPTQTYDGQTSKINESIKLLNEKTNALIGDEGGCGSSHTLSRWKDAISQNLQTTIYRPWVLSEPINSDSTYDIDFKNLEKWSLQDLSQKQAFEEYKTQLAITSKDLSAFLQKAYQWNKQQSDTMAYKALTAAISSGIRFYRYETNSESQKTLQVAITEKMPIQQIKQLAEVEGALSDQALNLAIKYPEALDYLLSKMHTPNLQNEFKKSLLMYAAQYNQLESAKILIKNKTDVNLSTIIPSDTCNYTLSKFGMTALHYAVRYASYDFVKLLLDNGAYPYAKTSEQEGGYPIDWLKKYTVTAAKEKNPNITQEQALALEALLKLPTPDEIAKKVLSYNLAAEQEFAKGNNESAYMNCKYALGLDEHNERALANLSLIALKMNKKLESLEASYNLINYGKDSNQVANALFNYGLTCISGKISYENYNGVRHCEFLPFNYFLSSFNKKSSSARANKIVESLKKDETPNCQFKKGNINVLTSLSNYGSEKGLYVLIPKSSNLDTSKIVWYNTHETKDANNVITKTRIKKSPEKLVNSYDLGDYTLNVYKSNETIYTPIEFDGETCNSQPSGVFTVTPSTAK